MDFTRGGYSHEEIKEMLHSSNRKIDFRYELLDGENRRIRDLTNVTSGDISQSMLAQIKRTANFSLIEDGEEIDYLSDRIKPYMRLWMTRKRGKGMGTTYLNPVHPTDSEMIIETRRAGWVEFPLGVFLLSSPTRTDDLSSVKRDIEAYDLSLILRDDKFLDRYTIPEGELYYDAIIALLTSAGITQYNIEMTDKVLPRTLEFEPGTEKIEAVNELLKQLNYTPIHVDEEGYFVSRLYVSPTERSANYAYIDDEQSITLIGAEEELDTFDVHNVFVVVRTNEEEEPLVSTYINDDPDNPLSTVNRGRQIVDYREIDNIADQEALDAFTGRIAFEANQVYGRIRFASALIPLHGYGDVLDLRYRGLGIEGRYSELNWSMKLEVGGEMEHELRQIIQF